MKGRGFLLTVATVLGFVFLYAPIVSLVVYSFNASKLVTVWGGFSTKWYGELLRDPQILGAAWLSLKIAFVSASLALVLGTIAAFALTRLGRFRTKTLLNGMVTAPLVMPEVITGLSLLLLFVAMESMFGWPAGRGLTTIIIAHTTFCMAFVAVVVQSRLVDMDESVEEAALDLGREAASHVLRRHAAGHRARAGLGLAPRLHPLPRRSGDRKLRLRPRRLDPADGDLLQGPARRQSRHQRAGHHHHRGGCARHSDRDDHDAPPSQCPPARRPGRAVTRDDVI